MLINRYEKNPILTRNNVPFQVNSIFNAAAVKVGKDYLLFCRVEMPIGYSSLVLARSENGIDFKVDTMPCITAEMHEKFYEYVEWGVEDPRITKIGNRYYILYTGYSRHDPLVMLAETQDFKEFIFHGPVTEPSNKDAVLFPEKIGGFYWKIDRPSIKTGRGEMWINKSADLINWGEHRFLMRGKKGTWETMKIGASTQPEKTEAGWLLLYHGVRGVGHSLSYKLGVMLLDKEEPWKVIGRSLSPILAPEMEYERVGDVNNVIFSSGWIIEKDGTVKIYYSGADTNICLATTTIDYLLSQCDPLKDK